MTVSSLKGELVPKDRLNTVIKRWSKKNTGELYHHVLVRPLGKATSH